MGSPIVRCVIAGSRSALPKGPADPVIEYVLRVLKQVRSLLMEAGLRIAFEIHKDLQAWEYRQLIEAAGPALVGTYLDTGNPIFVMEDPMTTLEELGAEITHGGHGHLLVTLMGVTHGFHDSNHSLSKDEVSAMRKFLTDAGVDPERDYPL